MFIGLNLTLVLNQTESHIARESSNLFGGQDACEAKARVLCNVVLGS